MLAPMDAGGMSASQDPRLSTTARGVELYREFVNVHENGLHDIFRFTNVVKDFQRDVQDKAMIAIEEDTEGVIMPVAQMGHDQLIVKRTERVEREIARLINPEIGVRHVRSQALILLRRIGSIFFEVKSVFWYKRIDRGVSIQTVQSIRTSPRRVATFTASVRLVTPSFSKRCPRWLLTVRSLMPR